MKYTINLIFKAVALAMGVAVTALSAMQQIPTHHAIAMLGLGLACLSLTAISEGHVKQQEN